MPDVKEVINKVTTIVADMQEEVDEWKDYSDSELRGGLTCDCDWWYKTLQTLKDALALLKAQEPRVMTLDEVKAASENGEPVCVETADGEVRWALTYPGIEPPKEGFNYPGGVLFDAVDVNDEIYDGDFYNMTMPDGRPHGLAWRAWTSRPDEKRRAETPWE